MNFERVTRRANTMPNRHRLAYSYIMSRKSGMWSCHGRANASVRLTFSGAHAPPPAHHDAFCRNYSRFRRDGPQQGNLEFESRLSDAFFQSRQDSQSHTAIEQRRRETTVHRTSRIEMGLIWLRSNSDTPALRLRVYELGDVCDGTDVERLLDRALADRRTDFVNIHTARPGCLLCRVERV